MGQHVASVEKESVIQKRNFQLPNGSYFGGKNGAGTYQTIINQIPPHSIFISGFLGRCGILRNIKASTRSIGIDVDRDIIDLWSEHTDLELYHGTFLSFIDGQKDLITPKTFIYLDPPYLHETRKSDTRYRHEMKTADHEKLIHTVSNLNCMVAISHYPSKLYDTLGWRKIQFTSPTRRGLADEVLHMNYPEPTELHDYSYLGEDYREREQIKKKMKSLSQKIKKLPTLQKAMLLDIISCSTNKKGDS